MPKALWNGQVIAEAPADQCQTVDGNIYFPPTALQHDYFRDSDTHSVCPWKGQASYYHVVVDGSENRDAAWYYPSARPKAKHFEGFVAFWNGVEVQG